MGLDDSKDYVRHGRAFATPRTLEFFVNEFDILRVASPKLVLEPPDCLRVPQGLPRLLEVHPAKREPTFGCSKSASQDIVESIEIASPFGSGNYVDRDFIPKTVETVETSTIDLDDGFRHPMQAYRDGLNAKRVSLQVSANKRFERPER